MDVLQGALKLGISRLCLFKQLTSDTSDCYQNEINEREMFNLLNKSTIYSKDRKCCMEVLCLKGNGNKKHSLLI